MLQVNHCKKCNKVMIRQTGWIGEGMIEYEVCIGCGHIEILSEGLTLEQVKKIESQKGYR